MLRPTPVSLSNSVTSSRRQAAPLMRYSEPPERSADRLIVTSARSSGRSPELLSSVSEISARPSRDFDSEPAKITSSIDPDLSVEGAWAPSTQESASEMLDFPDPLGPTMTFTPRSNSMTVGAANDLNPASLRRLTYIRNKLAASATPSADIESRLFAPPGSCSGETPAVCGSGPDQRQILKLGHLRQLSAAHRLQHGEGGRFPLAAVNARLLQLEALFVLWCLSVDLDAGDRGAARSRPAQPDDPVDRVPRPLYRGLDPSVGQFLHPADHTLLGRLLGDRLLEAGSLYIPC